MAGVAGLRFHEEMGATIRVLELGLTLNNLDYFESSTLFLVGADTGVSRDLSDTIAIGAEIGLRYQPKPSPAPILPGTGLENINDTGSRWSLPVSAVLTLAILMRTMKATSRAASGVRAGGVAGLLVLGALTFPSERVRAGPEQRAGHHHVPAALQRREQRRAEGAARGAEGAGSMGPEALDPISLLVADPVRDIRSDAILAVARVSMWSRRRSAR